MIAVWESVGVRVPRTIGLSMHSLSTALCTFSTCFGTKQQNTFGGGQVKSIKEYMWYICILHLPEVNRKTRNEKDNKSWRILDMACE